MGVNDFDFHLHSCFSDGRLSPTDLIRECQKAGVKTVALTDHEHIGGVSEAIAEGKQIGIRVIPGIEFSTDYDGIEHHVLGLGIDWQSPKLQDFLAPWAETKKEQIIAMIESMSGEGFVLSLDDVLNQGKGALNRAHIAYAVLARREENKAALERFEIKGSKDLSSDIFKMFLKEGAFSYRDRNRPMIEEVINQIQWLDGVAIWAHPTWKDSLDEIREKAALFKKQFGLDGIEVGYSLDYQTGEQALALHRIAQDLSLVESAGSDFHSFKMPFLNKIANFEIFGLKLNLPLVSCET